MGPRSDRVVWSDFWWIKDVLKGVSLDTKSPIWVPSTYIISRNRGLVSSSMGRGIDGFDFSCMDRAYGK